MSDVSQWLSQIQDLKDKLYSARVSEAEAHASADNWRKRYEVEAIQRRNEADELRHTIQTLQAQLAEVEQRSKPSAPDSVQDSALAATIHAMSPDQLQNKLLEVWTDRDRLVQDLKTEQDNHQQTREDLTSALGDTVSMLTQLQQQT